MKNEVSVEIERPIDLVFELTTRDVIHWSQLVIEQQILLETPDGVGTTFRSVARNQGSTIEYQGVVTLFDPPRGHAIQLTASAFTVQAYYGFEDLGHATRVNHTSQISGGKFAFRLMMTLCGGLIRKASRKAIESELNSLKAYCENWSEDAE